MSPSLWLPLLLADFKVAWSVSAVRTGTLAMALIGLGAMSPSFLPAETTILDQLHLGWLSFAPIRLLSALALLAGVALLLHSWLNLRPRRSSAALPSCTWFLWAVPVLLAPPLFSHDAYSYAAQGLVVQRGMDPYQTGPISVPGAFADQVDPMWLYTAAPYGPVALQVQHFIVWLTGGDAYASAVGMRLPALVSMAVIAYSLPRLARRVGVDPRQAVWLGVLNPLVLLHLVGGAHNDAMAIALVCLGLLLAARGQLIWASVAIAGAAGFKQTSVLALIGVAALVVRARRSSSPVADSPTAPAVALRETLWLSVRGGVVALVSFAALTQLTGLGWGWVPNLSVPASLRSLLSPPTLVGSLAEGAMYILGMPRSWQAVPVPLMRTVGLVAAAVVIVWLLVRVAPRRPVAAAAAAFTALCLGSPVIHPWYLLWGGVLFGAVAMSRRTTRVVVLGTLFLVGYSAIDAAIANGAWTLALTGVALAVWHTQSGGQDSFDEWRPAGRGQVPVTTLEIHAAR